MNKISQLSNVYYVLFFTLITYAFSFIDVIINIFFTLPNQYFKEPPSLEAEGIVWFALGVLLLAPVLETLLYQLLVYKIFNRFTNLKVKKNQYLLLFISALLFSLSHYYSILYIIRTFFLGLVLMYAYFLKAENTKQAFWLVTIIHALTNMLPFIIQVLI